MSQKILVTSALPYANGPIHFGHIAGAYLPADIYVRYQRMRGRDVIYMCGSDDHGVPITLSAEARGVSPEEHVAEYHAVIKTIFERMNISFDNFSQTSRKDPHYEVSRDFYRRLDELGHIEKRTEEQYFDESAGRFLADRYIMGTCPHCGYENARGDECGGCGRTLQPEDLKNPKSKISGNTPVMKETANWYLKLGDFAEWLSEWISKKENWRPHVINEVTKYLDEGLHTRPITRDLSWGIPVPTDDPEAEGKVLYVWFDAPIGYISSTIEYFRAKGEPDRWKEYWTPENPDDVKLVHFIGKDNIFFHAIMFPIMCHGLQQGYKLVDVVPANAFLTLEGRQFSKSEGWYIDPLEFLDTYLADSARYYLCSIMPETVDSEFRWDDFAARHNEMANVYGNIVHRVISFTGKNFGEVPPYVFDDEDKTNFDDAVLLENAQTSLDSAAEHIEKFEFRRALECVMDIARACHKYIDSAEPWSVIKENHARAGSIMHTCLLMVKGLAVASRPFLPDAAEKIWAMLGMPDSLDDTPWDDAFEKNLPVGYKFEKPEILFQRLEQKQMDEEKEKLKGFAGQQDAIKSKVEPVKPPRGIGDFQKWDLRVGEIVSAEAVPKSNKMLKLAVDIGLETRTVMAGIARAYKPDDLVGRKVILVANLEPKKLMGVESCGMVLAVGAAGDDDLHLLTPDGDAPNGARIS